MRARIDSISLVYCGLMPRFLAVTGKQNDLCSLVLGVFEIEEENMFISFCSSRIMWRHWLIGFEVLDSEVSMLLRSMQLGICSARSIESVSEKLECWLDVDFLEWFDRVERLGLSLSYLNIKILIRYARLFWNESLICFRF